MAIHNNEVTSQYITVNEAIQLYTGKVLHWPDGRNVVVVVMARDNPVSREFIFDTLNMSPYQFYESLDISIKIRKNSYVIKASNEDEVLKQVARYDGGIGYVSNYMYYNAKNEVKRLKIN